MIETDRYFAAYAELSKILRTWLVAYGIGAPILLTTNDRLAEKLTESGNAASIAFCFLAGVVAQVAIVSINKSIMWALYYGDINPDFKSTRRYRYAFNTSENMRLDISADVFSIVMFSISTLLAFKAVY